MPEIDMATANGMRKKAIAKTAMKPSSASVMGALPRQLRSKTLGAA